MENQNEKKNRWFIIYKKKQLKWCCNIYKMKQELCYIFEANLRKRAANVLHTVRSMWTGISSIAAEFWTLTLSAVTHGLFCLSVFGLIRFRVWRCAGDRVGQRGFFFFCYWCCFLFTHTSDKHMSNQNMRHMKWSEPFLCKEVNEVNSNLTLRLSTSHSKNAPTDLSQTIKVLIVYIELKHIFIIISQSLQLNHLLHLYIFGNLHELTKTSVALLWDLTCTVYKCSYVSLHQLWLVHFSSMC